MNLKQSRFRKNLIVLLFLLSQLPFLLLFLNNEIVSSTWYKIANISGFIGSVFLIWQFLLGVRGFSKWLTSDYDWVIKIHTFLGINGALFVLIHPILEAMTYKSDIRFIFLPNFSSQFNTFLSYGKLAFILFLFVWITSGLVRKSLKYRWWLYIHYLSYPMLFLVLIHPLKIGSFLQQVSWVYFYWLALCILAFIIILLKLLDILNISTQKFNLIEVKNYPGDTYTLKYKLLSNKNLNIKPGQYFYIKNKFIGEAHPFSVLEYSEAEKEVTFGIKKLGKYSLELGNSKVNETHYLDGPYGEFTFEGQNSEPKIILAGGIGVTPFYELVSKFGNSNTFMFFANKNLDVALYRDKFKEILKNNYFDFVNDPVAQTPGVFCEIISTNKIREILPNQDFSKFKCFICGSPGFTNAMINCILELGVPKTKIYIEEFEY